MIDATRRQWERYCVEHGLSIAERMVLYVMVHDHSATEGFTRPGIRRISQLSGASTSTIGPVLARLVSMDALRVVKQYPKGGRKADEYAIPWLKDASRNRDANRDANRDTSSPLRGESRSAPRRSGARGAAREPGDAVWCRVCEQDVSDECPCESCAEATNCVVNGPRRGLRVVSA